MELGPPSLLYNGYRVFPGGKIRGIDGTGATQPPIQWVPGLSRG